MPQYRVSSRTLGAVEVEASNWLVALGEGLGRLSVVHTLDRIACEVLSNGTILVRDVRRGVGYIVHPLSEAAPRDEAAPQGEAAPQDEAAPQEEVEDTERSFAALPEDTAPTATLLGWITRILQAADRRVATRTALEAAIATVPCEGGAVLLEQPDGSLLFAVAAGPEAPKLRNLVLPAGTGLAGFSVDHAVALTLNEPYADQRFYAAVDQHTGARTRSILCAPIAVEHKVYGCIELINAHGGAGFPREALGDVSLVADALAERLVQG